MDGANMNDLKQIAKISISGFRCFDAEQNLELATFSNNGNDEQRCGLTFIVGANNAGKTTLLEAIQKCASGQEGPNSYLRESDLNHDAEFKITLLDETNAIILEAKKIRCRIKKDPVETQNLLFIQARRQWTPFVDGFYRHTDLSLVQMSYSNNTRMRIVENQQSTNEVAQILASIEDNEDIYREVITKIKKIFPDFKDFYVHNEDRTAISYRNMDGQSHRADFLGDGVTSVILICSFLSGNNKCPLFIDEPELSLQPETAKRLMRMLYEESFKRQIIVSTHSPYMFDWAYLESGAKVNRLVRETDENGKKYTVIHTLKSPDDYKAILRNVNDWQKPQILDVVSKEIFFEDNILFVEGAEDVGLLKKCGKLIDTINIFGYGVGGYHNFDAYLKLAEDIGIKKATVIIDNGNDEKSCAESLMRKYRKYKIIQWDKEDIRDKEVNGTIIKDGYFYANGDLKSEVELGDFNGKIEQINCYFDE